MSNQDETTRLQAIREQLTARLIAEGCCGEDEKRCTRDDVDIPLSEWCANCLAGAFLAGADSVLEAARQEIATLTELAYHRQAGGRTWKDVATVALHDQASAEAQVDALTRAQAEWQPIETAPKDGETVIVYDPNYSQPVVAAAWDKEVADEGGQTWRAVDAINDRLNPILWQPLPSPPGEKSAEPATEATPDDVVCEHGTAMDVHCCGCHSGFLFDVQSCTCLFSEEEEVAETETSIPPIRTVADHHDGHGLNESILIQMRIRNDVPILILIIAIVLIAWFLT